MESFDHVRDLGSSTERRRPSTPIGAAWGRLVSAWRQGVHIQERLLELSRPWETQGPLRWQRRSEGWRLMGEHLPPFPG